MKKIVTTVWLVVLVLCVLGTHLAQAQDPGAPVPNILPPPPPPPPQPVIEIPKIPRMGEVPRAPKAALPRRGSFSDSVTECIQEGAAMGLGPNERSAYTRSCVNSR